MDSNIEKLKEQIRKLEGQIENMKNIDSNLSKRVEQNINVTGNLDEMLTAKSICDRLDIKPHVLGKIMSGLISKHEGQIQKGYSKIAKRDRQITFFGLTMSNNSIAAEKTLVANNPAPAVLKAEIPKPAELVSKPAEQPSKTPQPVVPTPEPIKAKSINQNELIKERPSVEANATGGLLIYDGYEGHFLKSMNYEKSNGRGWIIAPYGDKLYLIRGSVDQMSVLDNPPPYIQEIWNKVKKGEI